MLHYVTNDELQVTNDELQVTNDELQVTNDELQVTSYKLQVSFSVSVTTTNFFSPFLTSRLPSICLEQI